jgi:kinesin family member C1
LEDSSSQNLRYTQESLQAKIKYLESDQQSLSVSYAAMERQRDEAIEQARVETAKARKLQTQRRTMHDQIQNLKGNIRVVCRQRLALPSDGSSVEVATVEYPGKEEMTTIEVLGSEEESSLCKIITKNHAFTFDKASKPDWILTAKRKVRVQLS